MNFIRTSSVPSIYVSAPSKDIGAARMAMDIVRQRGWSVSGGEWVDQVLTHGSQGTALTDEDRVAGWRLMVAAIHRADGLLLLTPEEPIRSEGSWFEAGVAVGLGRPCVQVARAPRPRWAVAGIPMVRSVPAALHVLEAGFR